MKIRPASDLASRRLKDCLWALQRALIKATQADCPRLARKIRSAIKSAGGAERHMQRRLNASGK